MHLIPTILCGGVGSRLWPVSRELYPKPFIRLSDNQSLLQKAFQRGAALPNVQEILTVTSQELFFKVQDEFSKVNNNKLFKSYILEPFGRDTAAAIATASVITAKTHGSDTVMLVLPADHLIVDYDAFEKAVGDAVALAQTGSLVTFGIRPSYPETGYGYIEANGNTVLYFREKPNHDKAQEYLAAGCFLWNSGMFCFKAEAIIGAMELHCPEILRAVHTCIEQSRITEGEGFRRIELDAETFAGVPKNSIDYAVMEPASLTSPHSKTDMNNGIVSVVPCNIGWTDIGSWTALGNLIDPDTDGNRIEGNVLLHNTKNCYIRSSDRIVGTVGVEDLIIIDTRDAILVANKKQSQEVKYIYEKLKRQGHQAYRIHPTVHRPWGTYTIIEEGINYKIKRIVVKPGASLSLQMHHHRNEHWIVASGMAKVINGDQEFLVNINESTYVPAGRRHRLENPGIIDLVMIEVQSGEYLGEDDIVRFEDNYGRCENNNNIIKEE